MIVVKTEMIFFLLFCMEDVIVVNIHPRNDIKNFFRVGREFFILESQKPKFKSQKPHSKILTRPIVHLC
jgi:hypothetical protein